MDLNYRSILQTELERRKNLNPAYSLRAFARDLGLTAPQLSTVLKGTKGISSLAARKLASKLELSVDEMEIFVRSAEALHSRTQHKKESSKSELNKILQSRQFQKLEEPTFSMINEWYYLSILQTFELSDFEPNSKWLAKRLGLTQAEVDKSLKLLEEVGLLKEKDNFYKPSKDFVKTEEIPSRTIRFYLQQMLNKSSKALETQSIDERDFSTTVFSFEKKRMPEFKKKLREFREDFCHEASKSKSKDEVYALSIQFFKITNTAEQS